MKKCKICKEEFTPTYSKVQMVCSTECSIIYMREQNLKFWRHKKRGMQKSIKTKQNYEKELEVVFNRYIRLRDSNKPCISCGASFKDVRISAGHYYPAGSYKNLRFDEDNVHGQCWYNCNKNQHGNLIEYRKGLIERIGLEAVESLESKSQIPLKLTVPELIEMKEIYKEKIKQINNKQ